VQGFKVDRQKPLPVRYDGVALDCAYRLDMVIEDTVVLELKTVEKLLPIHSAHLIGYLKLGGYPFGYLFNFNTIHFRDGIKRLVNGKP
jgi:GxxExxY protein